MNCLICKNQLLTPDDKVFDYPEGLDRYESWMKVKSYGRDWRKCHFCGFHQSSRSYPLSDLEAIYEDGYRHPGFRGETIEQTFERVTSLPLEDQENHYRLTRFLGEIWPMPETVLDIGSGIGIWPVSLKQQGIAVWCVEKNTHSLEFLTESLDLKCTSDIPDIRFDVVSLIHVLEHIEHPDTFLRELKPRLHPGGKLFIEVPDALEFKVLPKDHDEFNSCHLWMFDMVSLYKLLDRNGYRVTDVHLPHYQKRELHRIQVLCQPTT